MFDFDFGSDDWGFLDDNSGGWMGTADYSGVNNSAPWISGSDIGLSDTPFDPSYIDFSGGGDSGGFWDNFSLGSLGNIVNSVGGFLGSPTGQNLINGGLGAIGAYTGYQNNKDMRSMYQNYMDQMTDPFLAQRRQMLNESYTNPEGWLNGPEGQALTRVVQNATERRDASLGRLTNPINRNAELQDRLMAGLGNYRAGLSNSINGSVSGMQGLSSVIGQYGNADPYKPIGVGLESILRSIGNG